MIYSPLHIFIFCFSPVSFSVFLPYTPLNSFVFWNQRYPFPIFIIITSIMSAGQEGKSLSERIETPSISKDAAKKIALLEQEFISADVEQCMFMFFSILCCVG